MSAELPQPGSIISLVTNSQIRYVGTLEAINMGPEESSLNLSSVKSFGTEDRVSPNGHVPPAEHPFEFVVFKGTDIVTLDVKEYYRGPPRQAAAPPPPPPQPAYQPQPQASVWGPPGTGQPQGETWGAPAAPPPQLQYGSQPPPPPGPPAAAPAPTVVVTPSMQPRAQAEAPQPAPRQSGWSNTRAAGGQQQGVRPPPQPQQPPPPPAQQPTRLPTEPAGPPPGFAGPPPGIPQSQEPPQQPASYANAAGPQQANGGRGRGRGRAGGGRGRGPPPQGRGQGGPPRAPPIPVPSEDFNFEAGLLRFNKDQLKQETDGGEGLEEAAAAPGAYNKDDFFDALSSDLSDRLTTGEPKRRPFSEQRKVDMETFGGSGVARRSGRGRGRGRGRGGPGGGPGGRGRGRGRGQGQEAPVAVA